MKSAKHPQKQPNIHKNKQSRIDQRFESVEQFKLSLSFMIYLSSSIAHTHARIETPARRTSKLFRGYICAKERTRKKANMYVFRPYAPDTTTYQRLHQRTP